VQSCAIATSAAFITMGARGHFQRLRPLVSALAERDVDAFVLTDPSFADDVASDGGIFVDLFAGRTMAEADDESRPMPCRYVSFAGHFGDEIAREVAALRPSMVIADTFAVVGRVVARTLGVPYINVCAGHNVDPAKFVAQLEADPRVRVSPRCTAAVDILRDRHGFQDASPFSYVSALSDELNIYCEPEQYLTAAERRPFEPMMFFGSLPSPAEMAHRGQVAGTAWFAGAHAASLKVYVSFGTMVWWSASDDPRWATAADARAAFLAIANAIGDRPDVHALISLGGSTQSDEVMEALTRPNVTVASYVNQWEVLAEADVFMTHHGLNSTHESIWHETPMVSYPFIWDQPSLAAKCEQLGFALPLTPTRRGAVTQAHVAHALEECVSRRDSHRAAIARAHQWERDTIAARPAVVDRILGLR
jgi:UDP:flavonoid glycosyltransferase YjiC (YdhE family)